MKQFIYFCCLTAILVSCNTGGTMTENEKKLINSGDENTPMRVLTIDNEADSLFLRTPSTAINAKNINDKDLQLLIKRLKRTMEVEEGVGIAAPQVGIGKNLFLFCNTDDPNMTVHIAIDPIIIETSDSLVCFEGDGCLSIPGISGNSSRYSWIIAEYYDEYGNLKTSKLSGYSRQNNYTGIIFQHEFDHLQGVLFIDKLCK